MAYPTVEELQALSPALAGLTEDQVAALRITAIRSIETYTGQSFEEPHDEVKEVEVNNPGDVLYLPERLIAWDSIAPTGADPYDNAAMVLTHNGGRMKFRRNYVGMGYYSQALYEISGEDYPTQFGYGFVEIDGTWGWEETPQAILDAIVFDAEDGFSADQNALTPTVEYARKVGITRWSQGNLNLELSARPSLSARVVGLLDDYVFLGTTEGRMV